MASRPPVQRIGLPARVGVLLFASILLLTAAQGTLVYLEAEEWILASNRQSIATFADQISRDIGRADSATGRLAALARVDGGRAADRQSLLQTFAALDPTYRWIALASPDGTVIADASGRLEGQNLSEYGWFSQASRDGYIGAGMQRDLQGSLPARPAAGPQPLLIDIGKPVRNDDGASVGVLLTTVSIPLPWSAPELRRALLPEHQLTQALLVDLDGEVILAQPGDPSLSAVPASLRAAIRSQASVPHTPERWPDGNTYSVGAATVARPESSGGPGLVVLVRQPGAAVASSLRGLQSLIFGSALAVATLLGILGLALAAPLARALAALTHAASAIARGATGTPMPEIRGGRELTALADSVKALVAALVDRERRLKILTESVERRIMEAIAERQTEISSQIERLEQLSGTDGLTGLSNRRQFNEVLANEWERALRYRLSLSLILGDIDHFKLYNDTYGHQQGDECLRRVGAALAQTKTRGSDLAARYGGEEFAVILPHTDAAGALHAAERLLKTVRSYRIPHRTSPTADHVTLSLGVASLVPEEGQTPEHLLRLADSALYRAKEQGRNRVTLAGTAPGESAVERIEFLS